jgi:hypothetical protein
MKIFDISVAVRPDLPVWPGDPDALDVILHQTRQGQQFCFWVFRMPIDNFLLRKLSRLIKRWWVQ